MPKNPATNHFPTKLHEMLDEAEEKGHSHIVSWLEDGKSFRIHKPNEMVPILARFFRQTKYKSLLRQLQGYGFKRVTSGENKGNVSHHLFVRGNRALCMQMKRKQAASKGSAADTSKNNRVAAPMRARKVSQDQPDYTSSTSNQNNIRQLETNFRKSMQRVVSGTGNKHQLSAVLSAPSLVTTNPNTTRHGQRRPTGMDALRVEIGCSFSSSRNGSGQTTSFKRTAPQQPHTFQGSVSLPEFENGRLSKRQRSHEGMHRIHANGTSQPAQNASFSFSAPRGSQKAREDAILMEEKMQFEKVQQEKIDQQQFERLEKLCFSNLPQGSGAQQFQHAHHSTSNMGTLDLDISLTTTTTTTRHDGSAPQINTNTISNKFVVPSALLEPTPILSPKQEPAQSSTNISDGFTLSCDIDFSAQPESKNNENMGIVVKLPSGAITPNNVIDDTSLGRSSEVSDEIDEGIAEAFANNTWTFDSDCEEEEEDDWTKGITYQGKSDCVLEPDKFQIEEQRIPLAMQQQRVQMQQMQPQQLMQQHRPQLQAAMYSNRNLNQIAPRPTQLVPQAITGNIQRQHLPMQSAYALLTKPMPFQPQHFSNQIQIQQMKR